MDKEHPVVFIQTQDTAMAISLVRLLYQHGINGFGVTARRRGNWVRSGEWTGSFEIDESGGTNAVNAGIVRATSARDISIWRAESLP